MALLFTGDKLTFAQLRTAGLHLATFGGGAIAAIAFMSSHSVDIYAVYDQLNTVVADISKLVALATPLVTGAYAVYKASTTQKLKDVVADPKAPAIADTMPVTSATVAVADALKKNGA